MRQKIQKALVFIKPRNFKYCLEIFECLDDLLVENFSRTIPFNLHNIPKRIITAHYQNIKGKCFYKATIKEFLESEDGIVLCVYSGRNIIYRLRDAIGDTDPKKARKGSVRQIFSQDSLKIAFKEKRYLNNVIHSSGSEKDAERELVLWKDFEIKGL